MDLILTRFLLIVVILGLAAFNWHNLLAVLCFLLAAGLQIWCLIDDWGAR